MQTFTEMVSAYDQLWIFSDDFGNKSFQKFFMDRPCNEGYMKTHFDVKGFSNGSLSDNPSVIGRFSNLMKFAISSTITGKTSKKLLPLPKLIVIIPEDDILNCLKEEENGLTKAFGRLVKFIMTEHERGIASFKENIPSKSKKDGYPHILWILTPFHQNFVNNDERQKFNRAVEDTSKYYTNISCLELKKVWNPKDDGFFSREFRRFTADGYKAYWEAVDRTVRYCDSVALKKREKFTKKKILHDDQEFNYKNNEAKGKIPFHCQNDKYRWRNPSIGNDIARFKKFRKLPSPPRRF